MTTMNQIHRIRELYYEQDKNLNEIAIIMGCDWRTIRKYVDMEDFNSPPPLPASTRVHESKLDPFKPLIDGWLQANKLAPRKQRHTAKRNRWLHSSRTSPRRSTGGFWNGRFL